MLQLSSYERMRRHLAAADGTALTDTVYLKQIVTNWITAVSKQIETFLNRWFTIAAYTEYFDVDRESDVEFFVKGFPITTLTSVYEDSEALWEGNESEIEDCYIGKNNDSVVLSVPPAIIGRKTLRMIYTGGLAYSGVRSVFTISGSSGTWTAGQFVKGGTSDAVGIVRASTATTLTVENLYGIFEAGETLTEYTTEALTTAGDATATLSAITQQSLAESYPDIIRAAEMQMRFYHKHKDDFELVSTAKDATNTRRSEFSEISPLTQEVMSMLLPYRKRPL